MDYQVNYATVAAAATKTGLIQHDAQAAMTLMRLDRIAPAIPGSLSGSIANTIDAAWQKAAQTLDQQAMQYAEKLSGSARDYRAVEDTCTTLIKNTLTTAD